MFLKTLRKANVSGMFCSKKQMFLENILEKQNVSDKQSTKQMLPENILARSNAFGKQFLFLIKHYLPSQIGQV